MNFMKYAGSICLILLASMFIWSASPAATAPKGKPKIVKTKAAENRGTRTDENIKHADGKNTLTGGPAAPPDKGGKKTRGAGGYTTIDNWTPWYIKVYANGDYMGTLGPWEKKWTYTGDQCPNLYARADFDDGTWKFWGPSQICNDTWELDQ